MNPNRLFLLTAAAGAFCAAAAAGEVARNLKTAVLPTPGLRVELAGNRMEAVLPRLTDPDLKGGSANWDRAWQSGRFTVTRVQAVDYAHALQGSGEWEQLLPRTLIPRKGTRVCMGYDDEKLYIKIVCDQKQMRELLKNPPRVGRDGAVWTHENVDILLTANRNGDWYCQLLIDCAGNVFDAKQRRGKNSDPAAWNPDFYKHIHHGDDCWVLTLALPVKAWGMSLDEGAFLDGNIGRVELLNHEYSTLSPVRQAFNEADRFCRFWIGRKNPRPEITLLEMKNPRIGANRLLVTVANPGREIFQGTLRSAGGKCPVRLAPGQRETYALTQNAAQSGLLNCRVELLDAQGTAVDMAVAPAEVKPDMTLALNSSEFIAGGTPLHAAVAVNALEPGAELEIACGGRKERVKAASLVEFDFVPAVSEGGEEIRVTLLRKGFEPVSAAKKITVSGDPFDE